MGDAESADVEVPTSSGDAASADVARAVDAESAEVERAIDAERVGVPISADVGTAVVVLHCPILICMRHYTRFFQW